MNNQDTNQTDALIQAQLDYFSSTVTIPVTRLDADNYSADDIDGVTESVFGSGNLNYLLMQAQQTNDSIATNNPFSITNDVDPISIASTGPSVVFGPAGNVSFNDIGDLSSMNSAANTDESASNTDRAIDQAVDSSADANAANGNFTTAAGAIQASSSSPFSGQQPTSTRDGADGVDGEIGLDGTAGPPGSNGNHGTDGTDGNNGGGDDCCDLINVILDLDILIDLGDTITFIDNTVNNATDIITTVINNVTDITTNITEILNLTEITNIVNNILTDILCGDGLELDVVVNLLDTVTSHLNVVISDTIDGVLTAGLDLAPVTDLIDDLTGIDLPILTEAGVNLDFLLDLLNGGAGTDNGAGDTDLTLDTDLNVLGLQLPDVHLTTVLDPLEQVLGDVDIDLDAIADVVVSTLDLSNVTGAVEHIADNLGLGGPVGEILNGLGLGADEAPGDTDIGLDLATGLLGSDPTETALDVVLNPVEAIVGDVDLGIGAGLGLLGGGGTIDNGAGDSDLTLATDINIAGIEVPDLDLDIPLDPLEALVGDIDLDLNAATDLLEDLGDGNLDAVTDVANGLLGTVEDLLADTGGGGDPVGGIVETVTDLLGGHGGDPVTEIVEDVLGGLGGGADPVTDIVEDILGGHGSDPVGGVVETVTDLLGGHGGDPVTEIVDDVLGGLGGGSDPVGGVVETVTDLLHGGGADPVTDIVEDVLGGLGGGGSDPVGGVVETVTDLLGDEGSDPVTEIVEDVLGGIGGGSDPVGDVTETVTELLGGDGAEPVSEITETVTDLLGGGGSDPVTDLLDTVIETADELLGDAEDIISGLTENLGGALDILCDCEDSGGDSWTDILPGAGDAIENLLGGGSGPGDALPEPIGTVAEGLGALDLPILGGGGGGGGGHGGFLGGLFG